VADDSTVPIITSANDAGLAKEENSFTAKDTKDAEEEESSTAKNAKAAKKSIIVSFAVKVFFLPSRPGVLRGEAFPFLCGLRVPGGEALACRVSARRRRCGARARP